MSKGSDVTTQVRPAIADALSCRQGGQRERGAFFWGEAGGGKSGGREPASPDPHPVRARAWPRCLPSHHRATPTPSAHLHGRRVAPDAHECALGDVVRGELADVHGHGTQRRRLKAAPQAGDALLAGHLSRERARVRDPAAHLAMLKQALGKGAPAPVPPPHPCQRVKDVLVPAALWRRRRGVGLCYGVEAMRAPPPHAPATGLSESDCMRTSATSKGVPTMLASAPDSSDEPIDFHAGRGPVRRWERGVGRWGLPPQTPRPARTSALLRCLE